MFTIIASDEFDAELEQILDDICEHYTHSYAYKIVLELEKNKKFLESYPLMFSTYGDNDKYRKFAIDKKFTVFYIVDESEKTVILAHIFASIRDLPSLLGD